MAPFSARIAGERPANAALDNLRAGLAPRTVVDATACMRDVRSTKNDDELRLMRFASRVSDLTMARSISAIAPGVCECEVLAEAMDVLYGFGAEVPQCNLIVCSGPNTNPWRAEETARALEAGDLHPGSGGPRLEHRVVRRAVEDLEVGVDVLDGLVRADVHEDRERVVAQEVSLAPAVGADDLNSGDLRTTYNVLNQYRKHWCIFW